MINSMTVKKTITICIVLLSSTSFAKDSKIELCRKITNLENENLPARIDSVTTAINMNCKEDKNVVAVYSYQGDHEKTQLGIDDSVRMIKKTMLCSNPTTRKMLRIFDIEQVYYDANYEYIGSIRVSNKDCKK